METGPAVDLTEIPPLASEVEPAVVEGEPATDAMEMVLEPEPTDEESLSVEETMDVPSQPAPAPVPQETVPAAEGPEASLSQVNTILSYCC